MKNLPAIKCVSVIGLGKLGGSMLAGMASRGLEVIGVDVSAQAVKAVAEGHAPVPETDLETTIQANKSRIRATPDYVEAVRDSDISFVIVPTPSDGRGAFSIGYAREAFKSLGKAIARKSGYHVVVLTSTVLPGATRYGLLPVLEEHSGKKCGRDFGLCYNPEFIALGSVIHDFLNPDFYLLGQFDEQSGDTLEAVHRIVSANKAPVKRMSLENAEIAKIAINSFVTQKISFANMLADLCAHVPGGDVDVVSDAVGMDSRIGRKYLTGGLGFGGPCFPRDNVALAFLGRSVGADTSILEANDAFNRGLAQKVLDRLASRLPRTGCAAVLGLAYKPHSHVIEESAGIALCRALKERGYEVRGTDPQAVPSAAGELGADYFLTESVAECLQGADMIFVTTADPAFTRLSAQQLSSSGKRPLVVDFWRCLSPEVQQSDAIRYMPMGRCLDDTAAEAVLEPLWRESVCVRK